jgi:DNA polymerase beta
MKRNAAADLFEEEPKKRKLGIRTDIMGLSEPHENYNADITKILEQLATIEKNKGQKHKHLAYMTAVGSLSSHNARVPDGASAKKLDGVGEKIAKKVQEILDTGKLKKLNKYLEDPQIVALNTLCKVHGVGPKAAQKWVEEGVLTLDNLKKQKLTRPQQVGVKYFDDIQKRIPRSEMDEHAKLVKGVIKKINPDITVNCCGSYRRGKPDSGDIDILITHPNFVKQQKSDPLKILTKVVNELKKRKYLIDELANGVHQYMGICKLPQEDDSEERIARRIDIKLFPTDGYYPALLHFTGSGEHNRQLSCIAINKGFKLGEYALCPMGITGVPGEPINVNLKRKSLICLEFLIGRLNKGHYRIKDGSFYQPMSSCILAFKNQSIS